MPMASAMASISLFEYRVSGESCQVFLGLPLSGSTAWNSLSRACLAEPPAESPSTMNSSFRSGSSEAQSVSLPGSTATPELLRRSTFCAARVRVIAWRITSSAMRLPSSTCRLSHSSNGSRTICAISLTPSREISSFFTWPLNCGSSIFTDST